MWVCRAGSASIYYLKFLQEERIFLPWDGYKIDLSTIVDAQRFRNVVENERGNNNRTSVSNWSSQLILFAKTIEMNDYVLIPSFKSRSYCLAQVIGNYEFNPDDEENLYHSHKIKVLLKDIPRSAFTKDVQYSLGAYRTLFKVRDEAAVLSQIHSWFEQ